MTLWLTSIVGFCMAIFTTAEWFTSFSHTLGLLDTETTLLHSLDDYIQNGQARINHLRFLHGKMAADSCGRSEDSRSCMGNLVNQYALMKRFATTWVDISAIMADANPMDRFLWTVDRAKPFMATHEDVEGSIKGLLRIQLTYGFSAGEIASGIVGDSAFGTALSARDCFDVGHLAHLQQHYGICLEWAVKAKRLVSVGDYSISLEHVLHLLARCSYYLGNLQFAFEIVHEIARIAPNFTEAAQFCRGVMDDAEHEKLGFLGDFLSVFDKYADVQIPKNFTEYEKLCQQRSPKSGAAKSLRCYLWNGNGNPRLLLRPIKIEVESEQPMLYRFHDFVSHSDADLVKSITLPLLQRGQVTAENGTSYFSDYRVTKTTFMNDLEVPTLERIRTRIADATGFDMRYSEMASVANYGIGGHYNQHVDAFGKMKTHGMENGDRIATVLLYLSDVSLGGNTVFPAAGIAVRPIKGSAVMWYNLLTNGTVDGMSLHAGCPVATGEKWIVNKWIRERAQTTCAPCRYKSCQELRHRLPLGDNKLSRAWNRR